MSGVEAAGNLAAYSLQVAALAGAGLLAPRWLRLRAPRALHAFYQAVLFACLALPLVPPWRIGVRPMPNEYGFRIAAAARGDGSKPDGGWGVPEWMLVVCVTGAAGRLAWLALGLCRLRVLRSRAIELVCLPPAVESACERAGITARFFHSRESGGPVTFGLLRPCVLLPQRFFDLPPELQEAIARHELLHIARRDWAMALAEEVVGSLFWFHPVARRLIGRIRLTREQVVDRLAAGCGASRNAYIEALVAVASGVDRSPAPAPAFAAECHLATRISLLLKEAPMSKSHLILSLVAAVAVAGSSGVAAALCFPLDLTARAEPQSSAGRVYRIGNGVRAPKLLSKVEPKYSEEARAAKINGPVVLSVVIDTNGRPVEIRVKKSLEPTLDRNAADAVRQWTFAPGMKKGKPVRVQATIEVNFRLK